MSYLPTKEERENSTSALGIRRWIWVRTMFSQSDRRFVAPIDRKAKAPASVRPKRKFRTRRDGWWTIKQSGNRQANIARNNTLFSSRKRPRAEPTSNAPKAAPSRSTQYTKCDFERASTTVITVLPQTNGSISRMEASSGVPMKLTVAQKATRIERGNNKLAP